MTEESTVERTETRRNNTAQQDRCTHCGKVVERPNDNPFRAFECPIHGQLRRGDLVSFQNEGPTAVRRGGIDGS